MFHLLCPVWKANRFPSSLIGTQRRYWMSRLFIETSATVNSISFRYKLTNFVGQFSVPLTSSFLGIIKSSAKKLLFSLKKWPTYFALQRQCDLWSRVNYNLIGSEHFLPAISHSHYVPIPASSFLRTVCSAGSQLPCPTQLLPPGKPHKRPKRRRWCEV